MKKLNKVICSVLLCGAFFIPTISVSAEKAPAVTTVTSSKVVSTEEIPVTSITESEKSADTAETTDISETNDNEDKTVSDETTSLPEGNGALLEDVSELKEKRKATLVENGEVKHRSRKTSSDLWVRKLRCSCGSSFRKNRYHKAKDGTITYNYLCYNQVNNGKASERHRNGLDTDGFCDEKPITEWKMDMMAQYFLKDVWKSRKEDLLIAMECIQQFYKSETQQNTNNNMLFIDAQIEKSEKKLKNLIEIYTDGQINKDEFLSMRQAYDEELKKLKEQKNSFGKQQEIVENCILDMSGIAKALAQMVDMSNPDISKDLLNEVVTSIVPRDKKYVWNYKIDGNTAKTVDYIADGTKKCPDIHLDDCYSSSEASSDVSDLHIYSLLPTVKASPEKLSLLRNLHTLRRKVQLFRGHFPELI